jgi:hypothetical protein
MVARYTCGNRIFSAITTVNRDGLSLVSGLFFHSAAIRMNNKVENPKANDVPCTECLRGANNAE